LGCILLCLGTVVWGLRTPPLERVWRLQLQLRLGDAPVLTADERSLLQATLVRYPMLGDHMLEDADHRIVSLNVGGVVDGGGAYAVRRSADVALAVVVTSPSAEPIEIEASTATADGRGTADGEPFVWRPPTDGPYPQLIEIRLAARSQDGAGSPMHIELRSDP
jgi:hypothetical protein